MNDAVHLLLASASPRRRELLSQIGVNFAVLAVDVPEVRAVDEAPAVYVQRLARAKAAAGAALSDLPVLGADTIVVVDSQVLEKPTDRADGLAMLAQLSDRRHQVFTAVAVQQGDKCHSCLVATDVLFRAISPAEAAAYWATGEPLGKAGGYAIQGLGAVFVERIEGSYSAVVGLPLAQTQGLLAEFGVAVWNSHEREQTVHEREQTVFEREQTALSEHTRP